MKLFISNIKKILKAFLIFPEMETCTFHPSSVNVCYMAHFFIAFKKFCNSSQKILKNHFHNTFLTYF